MMTDSQFMDDLEFARQLQEEYDKEAAVLLAEDGDEKVTAQNDVNKLSVDRKQQTSTSLIFGQSPVDPSLELSDPNPNIHELFLQFNAEYFWGRLAGIEVRWSPRMTLCAGLCVYEGRGGLCSVRLSLPLLKLRPRKDMVETLLHEMIHAYLFVTDNDRDHDGHGPNFQKHMHRINKITGANISIYHTFHEEVAVHQQHWWRCDGPCQKRGPYFGYVKRAMNRAPSAQDFWWAEHQATCGGTYTKIREPEGYSQKKANKGKGKGIKNGIPQDPSMDIRAFIGKGNTLSVTAGSDQRDGKLPEKGKFNKGTSKGKTNDGITGKAKNVTKVSSSGSQQSIISGGVLIRKGSSDQKGSLGTASPLFTTVTPASSLKSSDTSKGTTSVLPPHKNTSTATHTSGKRSQITNSSTSSGKIDKHFINDFHKTSKNDSKESPTISEDVEVIDLEEYDFKPLRALISAKDCHLKDKSGSHSKHIHQGKNFFTPKNKAPNVLGGKKKPVSNKEISKFPKNFKSVCEGGGDFSDPILTSFRKGKKEKKYVIDELDSNEGLWEEGNNSKRRISEGMSQNCKDKNQHLQSQEGDSWKNSMCETDSKINDDIATIQENKGQNDFQLKQRKKFINDGERTRKDSNKDLHTIVSETEPSSDKNIQSSRYSDLGHQMSSNSGLSDHIAGQGFKLGGATGGMSFLAQIRKTFNQKVGNSENAELNIGTTDRTFDMSSQRNGKNSRPSKKRSSDEAFDEEGGELPAGSRLNKRQITSQGHAANTHHDTMDTGLDQNAYGQRESVSTGSLVPCPVCSTKVSAASINEHLDQCLLAT